MFRVNADHPYHTLAVDDLALVTDFLYRCSYFHNFKLSSLAWDPSLRSGWRQRAHARL